MRKVLSFSGFLMLGLVVSQFLPMMAGDGYGAVKSISNVLLYVCLSFIMINVGREFVLDKTRWKSYAQDYFIAMATAALPWFMIAIYYVFVLLPPDFWNSWEAWKENLLLSRFAAPTSAGILFTMLAAIGLKSSWIYKKIQVLAIFDDLDTILLMIPLQIMMIGLRWQLIIVVVIVFLLLSIGWQRLNKYDWRQDWKAILFYSIIIFLATQILYLGSKELYGEEGSIHIEVLLPAFVLGMIMKHKEHDTPVERKVSTADDIKIAQIDIKPERLGRRAKVDIGLCGDVKLSIQSLLRMLNPKTDDSFLLKQLKRYEGVKKDLAAYTEDKGDVNKIHPEYVMSEIDKLSSDDAVFTVDTGMTCVWGARYLQATGKRHMLGSFNHGSMANALPQAIGAALAYPGADGNETQIATTLHIIAAIDKQLLQYDLIRFFMFSSI